MRAEGGSALWPTRSAVRLWVCAVAPMAVRVYSCCSVLQCPPPHPLLFPLMAPPRACVCGGCCPLGGPRIVLRPPAGPPALPTSTHCQRQRKLSREMHLPPFPSHSLPIPFPSTSPRYANESWPDVEKDHASVITNYLDKDVGVVVGELASLGLTSDSLVMFVSDNGPHDEGGHNVSFFQSAGVFLVMCVGRCQ